MKTNKIVFLLILLLGVILRFYKLGTHNVWYDEVYMLFNLYYFTPKGFIHSLFAQCDLPLFYTLHLFWIKIFGEGEMALRFLPMLFGVLAIIIIYKLGRLFFEEKVGLISAFILAISPMHIWYSQEARVYTLAVLLSMLIVYSFFLALEKDKKNLWISFIIVSILGIYTHYLCIIFILICFSTLFLKRYRYLTKKSNKWNIVIPLIIIFSLPRFYLLWEKIKDIMDYFWIPKPSWHSLVITLENFNLGYNATEITNLLAIILFSVLFILGISDFKRNGEKTIYSMIFFLIPIFIIFLISRYWFSVYIDRILMLFSPFYYILIAKGIVRIKRFLLKFFVLALFSLLVVFSLHNYYFDYMPLSNMHHLGAYTKKPFKQIVQFIKAKQQEGDAVVYSHIGLPHVFWYYWRFDRTIKKTHFLLWRSTDYYWVKIIKKYLNFQNVLLKELPMPIISPSEQDIAHYRKKYSFKRIWLISSSWDRGEVMDFDSKAVRDWMDSHYKKIYSAEITGIWIDLYILEDA